MHSLRYLSPWNTSMMFVKQYCCGSRFQVRSLLVNLVSAVVWPGTTLIKHKWSEMQYRNMTTVLTREYLDARPDGWLEYAPKRIAQLYVNSLHLAASSSFCQHHIIYIMLIELDNFTLHLYLFSPHFLYYRFIVEEQTNATIRPSVRNILMYFYQHSHPSILASFELVLLLEIQEIS